MCWCWFNLIQLYTAKHDEIVLHNGLTSALIGLIAGWVICYQLIFVYENLGALVAEQE